LSLALPLEAGMSCCQNYATLCSGAAQPATYMQLYIQCPKTSKLSIQQGHMNGA
jgi:hypothetical protein